MTTKRFAPNGQPSNLNASQWEQVRTPAFKSWFGDWQNDPVNASKILDGNGEPLVVHHGTTKDFCAFSAGQKGSNTEWDNTKFGFFFIEDKALAHNFAKENNNSNGEIKVIDAFLNVRNPIDIRLAAIFNNKNQAPTLVEILTNGDCGAHNEDQAIAFLNEEIDLSNIGEIREYLVSYEAQLVILKDKFDGLISNFGGDNAEYAAFEPNQIKSASGNIGNFSALTDEIYDRLTAITLIDNDDNRPSNLVTNQPVR